MRRLLCLLAVTVFALSASCVPMSVNQFEGKTLYLQTNIWYESPTKISSLNFHKGSMLRAGTKVKMERISGGSIWFTLPGDTDIRFRIIFKRKYHPGLNPTDYAKLYFGTSNPLKSAEYASFTAAEKKAVDHGRPVKGMSKKAFLMTFGYPPKHRTQSLELDTWMYWTSRWVTKAYHFDSKGRLINPGGKR